jgi:hypothetical protein
MQRGAHKGTWTELMKPVVTKLVDDDMVAIGGVHLVAQALTGLLELSQQRDRRLRPDWILVA